MPRTEQVATLRAYLAMDADGAEVRIGELIRNNRLEGYGALVSAAFATAVVRRFSSNWTIADVVRIVANVRGRLAEQEVEIDARVAEVLMRRTLGDDVAEEFNDEASARAQIFVLGELVFDEGLDGVALDDFLTSAGELADRISLEVGGRNGDVDSR